MVVFHYDLFADTQSTIPAIYSIGRCGHLGVQVFFVVSGYCLAAAASGAIAREDSAGSFLYRRVRRIFPPLWFSMLLVVALPWLKWIVDRMLGREANYPTPMYAGFDSFDWLATASLLQAFRFPMEALHRKFQDFNVVYWSLAIEVQFYFIMTAALVLRRWYYAILIGVSILGCAAAWDPMHLSASWNTGWFVTYWPMFACGIALYELRMRGWWLGASDNWRQKPWGRAAVLALAAVGLLIILTWTLWKLGNQEPVQPHLMAAIVASGLWFSIPWEQQFALLPDHWKKAIARAFAPLGLLGTISYSVYLVHFNLHKLPRLVLDRVLPAGGIVYGALLLLSVFVLAFPFYWMCERPFAGRVKKQA